LTLQYIGGKTTGINNEEIAQKHRKKRTESNEIFASLAAASLWCFSFSSSCKPEKLSTVRCK
jgi:hypothetical protein